MYLSVPGPLRALPRTNGPALPESERFACEGMKWNRKSFQLHPVRLTWNATCRYKKEISWNYLSHSDHVHVCQFCLGPKGLMKSFSEPHAPPNFRGYYSWVKRLIFCWPWSVFVFVSYHGVQPAGCFLHPCGHTWSLGPLVQLKSWSFAED